MHNLYGGPGGSRRQGGRIRAGALLRSAWLGQAVVVGLALNFPVVKPAVAQEWPAGPVTMVVPFAAGSGVDALGRLVAPRLSEVLGQQIIVENVGGAGGMIGASRVAKAAPDGYLFLLGNTATQVYDPLIYRKPLYNPATEFAPVALVAEQPTVLIARQSLPPGNLAEFIAYAKANQTSLKFGSAGVGSASHLACALFNTAIGVNCTHVPYRGGGQAMQDLMAGWIDYQCPLAAVAIPPIRSRQVRAIAILAKMRSSILPDLASADEQGLTDFESSTWSAFFLPAGAPTTIVRKLHDATVATLDAPPVQERLKAIGFVMAAPDRRSPEYLAKFVASEVDKWTRPIKSMNVTEE